MEKPQPPPKNATLKETQEYHTALLTYHKYLAEHPEKHKPLEV